LTKKNAHFVIEMGVFIYFLFRNRYKEAKINCYRYIILTMRIDKNNPWQIYENFWDWLLYHPLWILSPFFGYAYFLGSTDPIN